MPTEPAIGLPTWLELAPLKYAFLLPAEMKSLQEGRESFLRLLHEGAEKAGQEIPELSREWVVCQDMGRLTELWKRCVSEMKSPDLAHDILSIHGIEHPGVSREPRLYSKEVIKDLMSDEEAYAIPLSDTEGEHLATLIHVGEKAILSDVRSLVSSLLRDPTGRAAF